MDSKPGAIDSLLVASIVVFLALAIVGEIICASDRKVPGLTLLLACFDP